MVENNPKIEINFQNKKINNTREAFLAENENLIIGPKGLTFQYYPTKKEKLKHFLNNKYKDKSSFYRTFNDYKTPFHNYNYSTKNIFYNKNTKFIMNNNINTLPKSMSQTNFFKKPKNSNEKKEFNTIFYNVLDYNDKKYTKNIYKNNKFFSPNSRPRIENIFKNINNQTLSKFKNNFKKKKEKKMIKTHFKALESIYIKPKEIYDLFKKEDAIRLEKLGLFNINAKKEKEHVFIEKRNEYKSDIKELLKEEQDIQNIIMTKEFTNLLGNNKYYRDVENYDKSKISDEESKIDFFSEDEEEKNKKINYLKKLAFEVKKEDKSPKDSIPYKLINNKNNDKNKEPGNEDDSFFEEIKKSKKRDKDNINILMEKEDQLKVGGKVYHMKKQMDKICKELLNKYKIYKVLKNKSYKMK